MTDVTSIDLDELRVGPTAVSVHESPTLVQTLLDEEPA